ncbi:hypothetical protein BH09PAT4_BH09PAT4_03890 [soil metagenome]
MSSFEHQETEPVTIDNWQEALLGKLMLAGAIEDGSNRAVKANIASHLEQSYLAYRAIGKTASEFSCDLSVALADQTIPSLLDEHDHITSLPGKRQPGLEESICATLERYLYRTPSGVV